MLILIYVNYHENDAVDLIFLNKRSVTTTYATTRNIAELKCGSKKQNAGYHGTLFNMQF